MKYVALLLMSLVLINCNKGVDGEVKPLSSNFVNINFQVLRFSNAIEVANPDATLKADKLALYENDPIFTSMARTLANCDFEQLDSDEVDGVSSYGTSIDGADCPVSLSSLTNRTSVGEVTSSEGVIEFTVADDGFKRDSGLISLSGSFESVETNNSEGTSRISSDIMNLTLRNDNSLRVTKNESYIYKNNSALGESTQVITVILEQAGFKIVGKVTENKEAGLVTSRIFNIDGENVRRSTFDQSFEAWYHLDESNI